MVRYALKGDENEKDNFKTNLLAWKQGKLTLTLKHGHPPNEIVHILLFFGSRYLLSY